MLNGDYEPSAEECEALARKFHPKFNWAMLDASEREGLLSEWREDQEMKHAPAVLPSLPASPLATQDQLAALTQQVAKLVELQQMGFKASVHLAVKTFSRVVRPILQRESEQRADLQKDMSQMRREFGEQTRRINLLVGGLLVELGTHRKDEIESREQRLAELEEAVDDALAKLAGQR